MVWVWIFPALQGQETLLRSWQFRNARQPVWHPAVVPGNVYSDLERNGLIRDPYRHEQEVQWVSEQAWEYKCHFDLPEGLKTGEKINLVFDGLDTYAAISLNGQYLGNTANMFRRYEFNVTWQLKAGKNTLTVLFTPAVKKIAELVEKQLPLRYPDHDRVFARKAAYQFGWDWGPVLCGAGIWKKVYLRSGEQKPEPVKTRSPFFAGVTLEQIADSIGRSFYFTRDGLPQYITGANWIPADVFPQRVTKKDYHLLLTSAKAAGINMLRVWGGGIYEADHFYQLCDSLQIMVWQDFMFANAMYPFKGELVQNIKAEVRDQVQRLSKYDCIVVWCGNNEIEEGWRHWGWQESFQMHGADSILLWQEYQLLFRDSLPQWVRQYDPHSRPYISTSPAYGWGNELSLRAGDSHYWGFWWGYQDWEVFRHKTGRFVSEWGMQALPTYPLLRSYIREHSGIYNSRQLSMYQKANEGDKKLKHYIDKYFFDSTKISKLSLEQYAYLSQCVQYYLLKNIFVTQMSQQPRNMGTLLWQYNDCWPAVSWSVTDYGRAPKGGWYALKKCFTGNQHLTDRIYPRYMSLPGVEINIRVINENAFAVTATGPAKYVYVSDGEQDLFLSDNFFDLAAGEEKVIEVLTINKKKLNMATLKAISLDRILRIMQD